MYTYAARIERVIDGDTIDLTIDLGFRIRLTQRIRLLNVNCPEHGTPEGNAATAFTTAWLAEHAPDLTVRTVKDRQDKYGRILGTLMAGARILNDDLTAAGHATPYDGRSRTLPAPLREPLPATPVP